MNKKAKNIVAILSSIMCFSSLSLPNVSAENAAFQNNSISFENVKTYGDVNGDGKVDSKDAVIILKTYAENLAKGTPSSGKGDVDRNGSVDSKDAVAVLIYYAQQLVDSAPKVDYYSAFYDNLDQADKLNKGSFYRDYTLYDINGDGVYEFILKFGNYEAEIVYKFWTIDGRDIKFCGTLAGGNSHLEEKDGKLYLLNCHNGYEAIYSISMNGNEVLSTEIYNSGNKNLTDYFSYGTSVKMYDVSDKSLLSSKSTANFGFGYYQEELY